MNQDLSLVGWPLAVTILSFFVVVCVIVVFAIISLVSGEKFSDNVLIIKHQ